ncbi:MAG: hypothetical protein KJO76_10620 [Gammaproteobacteria bacterium]|nr:hypothetical protein [Gammaproteobacteria bacterium]
MSTPIAAETGYARNGFAAVWGAAGGVAICAFAVWRLAPIAAEAFETRLTVLQWAVLLGNALFMAWSEGYRGFQKKFAPRVAARALYLYRSAEPLWVRILAPLFCFGYFRAARRTRLIAWWATFGIVILVVLVNQLQQPWRGIIDAGVVVGLTWGIAALLANYAKSYLTGDYPASPEVPGDGN